MGRDKALLPVDGVPMAVRVASALHEAGAAEVVAVGGNRPALTALGLAVVADDEAPAAQCGEPWAPVDRHVPLVPRSPRAEGPLAGIVTALGVLSTDVVLVVACDLTGPSPEALAATVEALQADPAADLAVPRDAGGRRQWLHAAWRRRARPGLLAVRQAGERSVHGAVALAGLRAATLTGLPAEALADADNPAQLPRGAD